MTKNILAIDPGKSGGMAWTDGESTLCRNMPDTVGDLVDTLHALRLKGIEIAYVEKINGFVKGAGAGQMFHFGQGVGRIEAALYALKFKAIYVTPQAWQKALSIGAKKDHGKNWKNHLKDHAQRRYPNVEITLKTADSLLILEYAKLNYTITTQ